MSPLQIVNFAEIAERNWRFLEKRIEPETTVWRFHVAMPRFWIERIVKRPNIARLRAGLCAGYCARSKKADVIISHLPRATLWIGLFSKLFQSKAKHLAFSFNFTELPSGINRLLMRYVFDSVDRFVVFSEAERHLYASYFTLDINRFDVIRWCMDKPKTAIPASDLPKRYICAVGGEGRDYQSLLLASRLLPDVPVVIVTRPGNLIGLEVPAHVLVFTNLISEEFWGVVQGSSFVVLPLNGDSTNCGHISIVGSQLLGKPIVSTHSSGTSEYLKHGHNALMSMAGDSYTLSSNIQKLWEDRALHETFQRNVQNENPQYAIDHWVDYLESYFEPLRKTGGASSLHAQR